MSWDDYRDGVTVGVFVVGTLFGLIGACNHAEARKHREAIQTDATPIVETCVKHPVARRVVVQ